MIIMKRNVKLPKAVASLQSGTYMVLFQSVSSFSLANVFTSHSPSMSQEMPNFLGQFWGIRPTTCSPFFTLTAVMRDCSRATQIIATATKQA